MTHNITMLDIYNELVGLQKILWKNDDLLLQEDLFEIQEKVAELTLQVAESVRKTNDLLKDFPWLYKE